jgi:AcrR family transcriptional regulator
MARTGRRPSRPAEGAEEPGTASRRAILGAARTAFGELGFEGASMRAIAATAGVDAALIHHYFGSKQQLFVAAMDLPFDIAFVRATVTAGPVEGLGERIARFFLTLWENPIRRPILLGMLRSATTDPAAAAMVRRLFIDNAVLPLAVEAGLPDAEYRATLVGSQLLGLALLRYVLGFEPLASASIDTVVAAIGPTIQRYVSASADELPPPGRVTA